MTRGQRNCCFANKPSLSTERWLSFNSFTCDYDANKRKKMLTICKNRYVIIRTSTQRSRRFVAKLDARIFCNTYFNSIGSSNFSSAAHVSFFLFGYALRCCFSKKKMLFFCFCGVGTGKEWSCCLNCSSHTGQISVISV